MPTFNSKELIANLEQRVHTIIQDASTLKEISIENLNRKPSDDGWSITEVLAHLNFYADFYTNAMQIAMKKSNYSESIDFKSGWIGNYFTRVIGPAPVGGELEKKMASPANARPSALPNLGAKEELIRYLDFQKILLDQLQQAQQKNLQKTRVPLSLSPYIKMRLGDTFRFVIAHEERHWQQIARLL